MKNALVHEFLSLKSDPKELLLRAGTPTHFEARADGAVVATVPFRENPAGNDSPSGGETVRNVPMMVRAYGEGIVRITLHLREEPEDLRREMFEWDPSLRPEPLAPHRTALGWELLDTAGRPRFRIRTAPHPVEKWSDLIPPPTETFEAEALPDGETVVAFSAQDTFTPDNAQSLPLAYVEREGAPDRVAYSLHAAPDEHFAGTGERFRKMDLSGGTYHLLNTDATGVNNPGAYKNVPFYVSSRGYGLLVLTPAEVRLSLADLSTRAAQGVIFDSALDLFFIAGTPERITHGYRQITGFPRKPPLWSFGTWMSRMTYFSAQMVEEIGEKLRAGDFPCDVLHLDTGWFQTDWKCEWEFSKERFPDPEAFLRRLRANGFRVTLWQLPAVAKGTLHYEEAIENRFLAPKTSAATGSNFGSGVEDGGSIDFSNPEAVVWYQSLLARLFEKGVAAIKTDFGEVIEMHATYRQMPSRLLRNLYALLYQKAAFEVTERMTGDAIIWARAGWTGCQRYPVHWGGDCAATWDGLAGSIRGGLHLGASGFGHWSHDVPGFHGLPDFMNSRPTETLYVRWTQAAVFGSHLRYHGTSPREPWEYPSVANIVREWLHLRYALIPYLLDQSEILSRTGFPLMRPLFFQHPHDPLCWNIDDQFFCGDALLVAPIMRDSNRRSVYLPSGRWVDFWTGAVLEGPQWVETSDVPLERIPVYAAQGATIRVYPERVQSTDEMDLARCRSITFDASFHGIAEHVGAKL
jgi:alpha-D-xyloside xylohydrolase